MIIKYLIAGAIGFLIGTIITCILLCKKNFEMYQNVQKSVGESANTVKANFETAKAVYRATIDEYENGTDEGDAEEAETESEEAEEE